MTDLSYRELSPADVHRVADIDRTEITRIGYKVRDERLVRMAVAWDSSPWRADGPEHSIPCMVHYLEEMFGQEGRLMGAWDGGRVVGMVGFRPRLRQDMAQLAFLHVSNGYRRQGIGSRLLEFVEQWARESGARQLYVSATPSESAVGFYLSRGFALTARPLPELLRLEPDDIHMVKNL